MKIEESVFAWPSKDDPVFEIFENGEIKIYEKLSVNDYEDIMKELSKYAVAYRKLEKQIWNGK